MKKIVSLIISVTLIFSMALTAYGQTKYTVKEGDTIAKIAQEYEVTVEDLVQLNDIKNPDIIYIGQELEIPSNVKNVILLVGDGMGVGQMELARLMEYGKEGRLHMESMPNVALVHTYSYDNMVTDSAAAGSAIATGEKTVNKRISMLPDGTEVDSLADVFKEMGKKVGIISTNTIYDATPAAFGASEESRSNKSQIVMDLYNSDYDVLLSGGTKYFSAKKQDGVEMVPKFEEKGYTYVETKDELMNVEEDVDKLLGLFSYDYMSYKADREEIESTEPTLKEMTETALNILSADNNGFFLMSEGARIDHASHAADATGVWLEVKEFDETVKYCLDWAKENGDTLVIVTADHETMAFAPTETLDIDGLKSIQVSPEYIAGKLEKNEDETLFTLESIKANLKEYAGIELTDAEAATLQGKLKVELYTYKLGWEIGSVIAEHYGLAAMDTELREKSVTGGHTANMVPLFAEGYAAEKFNGVLDNTDIYNIILEIITE